MSVGKRTIDDVAHESHSADDATHVSTAIDQNNVETTVEVIADDIKVSSILKLCRENNLVGYPQRRPLLNSLDHGWFYGSNREVIDAIVNENTDCIVELGSWLGRSAAYFVRKAPRAAIFTVDLWSNEFLLADRHYTASNQNLEILRAAPIYDQYIVNTWDLRFQPRMVDGQTIYSGLIPMKMDSVEALHLLKSFGIAPQVIYVDACHHYHEVIRDVEGCLECFPEAELIGDDWDYQEVRDAVKALAHKHGKDLFVHGNKCWTFSGHGCADKIKIAIEKHKSLPQKLIGSGGDILPVDKSLTGLLHMYKKSKQQL